MALPNNNIPRLFINTGIEYLDLVNYVKELSKIDKRIIILNSNINIRKMLNSVGFPFKSKMHSKYWDNYVKYYLETEKVIQDIEKDKSLLTKYNFIHNLPNGIKTNIKYIYGVREQNSTIIPSFSSTSCPKVLRYQFTSDFVNNGFAMSDKCCYKLKKEPAQKYANENGKSITITGIRADEGGSRALNGCTIFLKNELKKFHPLLVVDENWEEQFLEKFNIKLCKLYYPPYNFKRTGCKGCPFNLELQRQLDIMEKYLPNEKKQCEIIFKPVYDEYKRIGYRLRKYDLFDFLEERGKEKC